MNKRGTISLLQILILLIGIFSFSVLSSGFVSAEIKCETILGKEVCTNTDTGVKVEIDNSISSQASQKEKVNIDNPPATPNPTHGFSGSAYEWAFGKGTTAEKNTLIPKGEDVEKHLQSREQDFQFLEFSKVQDGL